MSLPSLVAIWTKRLTFIVITPFDPVATPPIEIFPIKRSNISENILKIPRSSWLT
jgi:hypothetical protein